MTKRIRRIIRTAALITPFLLIASGASAGAPTSDDTIGDDFADDFVQVVPEPTAALVMALGVAAVAYAHRRRR